MIYETVQRLQLSFLIKDRYHWRCGLWIEFMSCFDRMDKMLGWSADSGLQLLIGCCCTGISKLSAM